MFESPVRSIGRLLLAACAVSLGVTGLQAQTAAPAEPNPSRADVFLGYSYFGTHSPLKPANIQYTSIDLGAIGSGAYYFNKYVGGEVVFAAHPDGKNDGLYTISAGPIFRYPASSFTVFGHGLVGAAKLGGPNNSGTPFYHNPYQWGVALTAGGGMDYDTPLFNHKLGIRLFQADYQYVHANFGPYTAPPTNGAMGGRANLSAAQLSTGILWHIGSIIPPPPVTYSCVASPSTVFPGDPVTVTGTAANLNPKKTATYSWTSDGGTVSGTSSTANVDTKTLNPGSYTVKGHVEEGKKAGQFADCSAPFTVKAFEPPTISCSASPSSVRPGESATITANGVSPQNRPLTYSYSSTAGSVSGSGSSATLSTAGAAPGTVTVTCNVVDDKGQTAAATTTVSVIAPPPPPAPKTSSLCSVNFERDKKRPTRVDNEGKACLDDVALNLQRSSDAKVALAGSAASKEKKGEKLASERALNAKEYLVKEKGIDASRVATYSSTTDGKTVTTTLIPAGATFSTDGLTEVTEPVKPVVKHHAKKK
ncbi:OmpA family protein [Terriglobus tenax]|uniref:OmpA family protein n=1 Tax=Terriglobus tenax TaxID=1111115 RepID=UPI0021DF7327|nr:OmpA family protein [Terriglobus tenax]